MVDLVIKNYVDSILFFDHHTLAFCFLLIANLTFLGMAVYLLIKSVGKAKKIKEPVVNSPWC